MCTSAKLGTERSPTIWLCHSSRWNDKVLLKDAFYLCYFYFGCVLYWSEECIFESLYTSWQLFWWLIFLFACVLYKTRQSSSTVQRPGQCHRLTANDWRLPSAHHRCLRRILNISWQDKVRNERVRELTRQDQLLTKIREHRLRWWGHIQRMEGGRQAKQALKNWIPEGSHKIGWPCMTWNDNIRKDIENSGVTWEEALLLMTDRKEWRSWFAQCARHGMD